jgi:hypothetical protein
MSSPRPSTSIGFFWKADRSKSTGSCRNFATAAFRPRGGQTGKPNKLVYTLTPEGRAALKHWAARPSRPASIKDDLLARKFALGM